MKALTLHEPFASLIAYGWKEVETRGWYTPYRGPLAIHAGLRKPDATEISRFTFLLGHKGFELPPLAKGAIVCVCELAYCVPTGLVQQVGQTKLPSPFTPKHGWEVELQMGNYDRGRWAWILRDVQRLDPPMAARGMRKLWAVEKTLENLILGVASNSPCGVTPPVSTAPATASQNSKAGGI